MAHELTHPLVGAEVPEALKWANLDAPTTQEWGILLGVPEKGPEACWMLNTYPMYLVLSFTGGCTGSM